METATATLVLGFLCALGLSACGGEPALAPEEPWPSAAERTLEPDHAPTPFTAEQIREACAPGRVSTYRFDEVGKEPYLQTFHFLGGDQVGCNFEIQMADLEGNPLRDKMPVQNTWLGFQQHASYPKDKTRITNEEVTVPAGSYACFHYQVVGEKDGKSTLTHAFFAWEMPGPPVKMTIAEGDQVRTTMTLIAHEPAPAPRGP